MNDYTLSVRLPENLAAATKLRAEAEDRSVNSIIRLALLAYLEQPEPSKAAS